MPSLPSSAKETIKATLDAAVKSDTGVPGLAFLAVDRSGDFLTKTFSGYRSLLDVKKKTNLVDIDSVFYIASCTKMITGIACMQLVDEGQLDLDSYEQIYKVCPELKEKKVLRDDGTLEDRRGEITTRLLLTHTAGFGYTFFNAKLRDYSRPAGYDEFAGEEEDYLDMPLVNHPGERWEYGINIDWAGIIVERISGMTLDDYFKKNIFKPLGIENISFIPTKRMLEHLVTQQQRDPDGTSHDADHVFRRAIWHAHRPHKKLFHAGGAGCFAKPADYCQIIATLLNDGKHPKTHNRILSKKAVDEMFTNQIPQFPDYGRQGIPDAKPSLTNPIPDTYPQEGNPPQGWGLTFQLLLTPGPTGRAAGAANWAGIINSFWWCDRENGVGGFIAGQVLPFGDMGILTANFVCEKAVYDGLESGRGTRIVK